MAEVLTLESLFRAHHDFVRRLAQRRGGALVDADDVVQEVFLVVARTLERFDPRSAKVTTWLYGITVNVVRGLRRQARLRQARHDGDGALAQLPDARANRAALVDAWQAATRLFAQLSPLKRQAFCLELAGLTCAEIGALVGAKEETVWSRLHYARRELMLLAERAELRV